MSRENNYLALAGFGLASLVASAAGGALTATTLDGWYQTLSKPAFAPPDWLFGPVWTVLFAMMAVAAWWVWRRGPSPNVRNAMWLHALQLLLNVMWTAVFFAAKAMAAAFFQILVLWLAVFATMQAFGRVDRGAAMLMLPYLVWVSFAALLNAAYWYLN